MPIDATVRMRDGRGLAYCEWGDAGGPAVLAFHGAPGSRVWWPDEDTTAAAGVRLVAADRPGYGRSDPLTGRPIVGWVDDVVDLTQALGIERFGVVGWSGGAPYAAAVAARLPDRLTGVCVVSSGSLGYFDGVTEPDDEDEHIAELVERFGLDEATIRYAEENREWAEGVSQNPMSLFAVGDIPAGDRWLFDGPPGSGVLPQLREGVRQGAIGVATDWALQVTPWGFSLDEIEPAVHCWHGAQDPWVDLDDFKRVVAAFPQSTLTVWPDGGHFGIARHWGDVLGAALGGSDHANGEPPKS
jgi:pimeloyl-ACP methyl ester carboxylesterase